MNKRNITEIRNALCNAYAAQVRRTLDVLRLEGWEFPADCDVGVSVIEASPLAMRVAARIDDVRAEATIGTATSAADILKAVDELARAWLAKRATKQPSAKHRVLETTP